MYIDPKTSKLIAQKDNASFTWKDVVGELIDNAFDAKATRVDLQFGQGRTFAVIDNGNGCDNLERMLIEGDHYNKKALSGRYGVGLKDAATWLWGQLSIESATNAVVQTCLVDWAQLAKQDDWSVADPIILPSTGNTGTTLRFMNITRAFPDYEKLVDEISYLFAPALWKGAQITIKTQHKAVRAIEAWHMPPVEKVVNDTFEVNGKAVKIDVGIVKEGHPNLRKGFSYCQGHRVVISTAKGSNGHSVSRVCGIVGLSKQWTLARNKDGVLDDDMDLLEHEIFRRCEAIIMEAETQAERIESSALAGKVSQGLSVLLQSNQKEKRESTKEQPGTIKPEGTKKQRRKSKRLQPGDKLMQAIHGGSMRMEWDSNMNGDIGRVDLLGRVIYLNPKHARLEYHKRNENHDALIDVCMALFASKVIEEPQRELFKEMSSKTDFVDAWGYAMAMTLQPAN